MFVRAAPLERATGFSLRRRDDSPESRHHRDHLDNRANALTSKRFGRAGPPHSSLPLHGKDGDSGALTPKSPIFVATPGPSPGIP